MSAPVLEYPEIASREEWLRARLKLLEEEKELTRLRDRINTHRRMLPMVKVEEAYTFGGPDGRVRLVDMFAGRPQLIVYHFMWLWDGDRPQERGCRSCSAWADELSEGLIRQLNVVGTTLVMVSRAPYEIIANFKRSMGWTIPWYSCADNRFAFDYQTTIDPSDPKSQYNYRTRQEHEVAGSADYFYSDSTFDLPGFSCFLMKDGVPFHTYSTYGRGCESVGGPGYYLDLTALGRQEDWELPPNRSLGMGQKAGSDSIRYPDEYETDQNQGSRVCPSC